MRKDDALIFEILTYVESQYDPRGLLVPPKIKGYTEIQIGYHINLCIEAGYIEENQSQAARNEIGQHLFFTVGQLTSLGRKKVERMRNEGY